MPIPPARSSAGANPATVNTAESAAQPELRLCRPEHQPNGRWNSMASLRTEQTVEACGPRSRLGREAGGSEADLLDCGGVNQNGGLLNIVGDDNRLNVTMGGRQQWAGAAQDSWRRR
ncbi:hypothetical protein BOX15_Mlig016461g2 [Macrostomum lignano]|nr:hypothetical protein BOX15_Mlig016461g2 [Macrostomum lignano]